MPDKKLLDKLDKIKTAVREDDRPRGVIRTPSPSINWVFGGSHYGLPRGYTIALWGKPKGGKSIISMAMSSQAQQDFPDGVILKFDVEGRHQEQFANPHKMNSFGVDSSRFKVYEGNRPENVFDVLTKDIAPLCEEGLDIPLIIIDSASAIMGTRASEADSINDHQIGDQAMTLQKGLGRILPFQRRFGWGLILVCQARANLQGGGYGPTHKMQAANALQHYSEYFVQVDRNNSLEGRKDSLGNSLEDESRKDFKGKSEKTGHHIRVTMQDSTLGPVGRTGEFTLDYNRGIINQHEEVYTLGTRWGVVHRPNVRSYEFGSHKWTSKKEFLGALQANPELQTEIMKAIQKMELSGRAPESQLIQGTTDEEG